MVTEEEALVGRVDDEGVAVEALLLQVGVHLTDGIVDRLAAREIVLHVAEIAERRLRPIIGDLAVRIDRPLVEELAVRVLLPVIRLALELEDMPFGEPLGRLEIGAEPHVMENGHRRLPNRRRAPFPIVEQRRRHRNVLERHRTELQTVLLARNPVAVRRLMMHHHIERLARRQRLIDHALRELGDVLGRIFAGEGQLAVGAVLLADVVPVDAEDHG